MKRLLAPILLLAGLGMTQETGYNTAWSGHRTYLLNTSSLTGTPISSTVLKFPTLVRLGAADSAVFQASKAKGTDIRFTKSNNTTRLQHQIERWDSTGRKAEVWVLLDSVYANSSTQSFRMHWGNAAAADSSKGAAVFDSSNGFLATWHLGDSTGVKARPNSVAGGNPAMPAGSVNTMSSGFVPIEGIIGPADTLRNLGDSSVVAGTDHFALGDGYTFAEGTGTMSMWVKVQNFQSNNFVHFLTLSGPGANGLQNNIWIGRGSGSSGNTDFRMRTSNGTVEGSTWTATNALAPLGTWQHFSVSFWGTLGRNKTWYKNGVMIGNGAGATGFASNDTIDNINPVLRTRTYIGRSVWGDRNLRGSVDEVRISKVVRSADWVRLEYANQNAAQSLVTVATTPTLAYVPDSVKTEVSFAASPITPAISGVPAPTFTVSPALPGGLSLNAATGVISGTPAAASGKTKYTITATNSAGTVTDSLWITVAAPTVTEDYSTWSGTKTLTFSSGAAMARFPLLVRLGASDSAVFSAGRASLRFSKTDGAKLRYEIDSWDSTGRAAAVWVLVDNVNAGSNALRLHWGKAGAANLSDGGSVFEASNGYVGVWHLGNAPGIDPRPNAVAGAPAAIPSSDSATTEFGGGAANYVIPAGVIGMADTLRARVAGAAGNSTRNAPRTGSDYLNLGNAPGSTVTPFTGNNSYAGYSTFTNGFTYSLWVKPGTPIASNTYMLGLSNAGASAKDNIQFFLNGTSTTAGTARFEDLNNTTSNGTLTTPGVIVSEQWQRLVVSIDASRRVVSFSRNGVDLLSGVLQPGTVRDTLRVNAWIGKSPYNDPYFRGAVDDPRLSNVPRSSDWNLLEYQTQAPGVMPVSVSYNAVPANYLPNVAIAALTPVVSGSGARFTVSPALPAGLAIDSLTGVISGTPTAGAASTTYTVTATNGAWTASAPVTFSVASGDGAYATAWSGHKFVSVNATTAGVTSGNVLKFPLLVNLGAADSAIFNASQANGADIRFTKLGDAVRLKHEIESWDKAGRRAAIWVLVDTVYGGTTGSRLRLHYGNPGVADSSKSSAVFDTANGFIAVYHLGNPVGAAATGVRPNAARPGTNDAAPTLPTDYTVRTGLIGMADTLRGNGRGTGTIGDHFNLGTGFDNFGASTATISMWLKPTTLGTGNFIQFLSIGNTVSNNGSNTIWMGKYGDATNTLSTEVLDGTTSGNRNNSGALTLGAWQHLAMTLNGPNNNEHINYLNGVAQTVQNSAAALQNVSRANNYIGRSDWTGDTTVKAMVDEVRISKAARSANWIKLEYANQNASQNLVALTDVQSPLVTGIQASASVASLGGPLSVKALGQGLMFQVRGEAAGSVRIAVIDMFGRTLWNRTAKTGASGQQMVWDGRAANGLTVSAGIYVVRMDLLDAQGVPTANLVRKVPLTR